MPPSSDFLTFAPNPRVEEWAWVWTWLLQPMADFERFASRCLHLEGGRAPPAAIQSVFDNMGNFESYTRTVVFGEAGSRSWVNTLWTSASSSVSRMLTLPAALIAAAWDTGSVLASYAVAMYRAVLLNTPVLVAASSRALRVIFDLVGDGVQMLWSVTQTVYRCCTWTLRMCAGLYHAALYGLDRVYSAVGFLGDSAEQGTAPDPDPAPAPEEPWFDLPSWIVWPMLSTLGLLSVFFLFDYVLASFKDDEGVGSPGRRPQRVLRPSKVQARQNAALEREIDCRQQPSRGRHATHTRRSNTLRTVQSHWGSDHVMREQPQPRPRLRQRRTATVKVFSVEPFDID